MNGKKDENNEEKEDNIKIISQLYKGSLSEVYKIAIGDEMYVKKVIANQKLFLREVAILQRIDNLHSPRLHTFYEEDGKYVIIQEFVDGMDCKGYIASKSLSKDQFIFLCIQILKGFLSIHNSGVYHRDVKPANVMITDGGIVKIIDYGLSCIKGENCDKHLKGTPYYIAPELFTIEKNQIEEANWHTGEIYSIGCLLYFILHGYAPYELITSNLQTLKRMIASDEPTPYDRTKYKDIDMIIYRLLMKDPRKRMTLEEALERFRNI
jgi:serine/threonine protein kinase